MPKPVCVKCRRFMWPKKNGFPLVEGRPRHNNAQPGAEHEKDWEPYKLWLGDLWECKGCGIEIVVGFGYNPIAHNHEPGFQMDIIAWGAKLQVNDY